MPSNGPNLWPVLDSEPINPPYMRRAPGRPKKQRKKANDEPQNPNKLRRQYTTFKCKKCDKLGHNVRTCKDKTAADREIPKGGNKKQKKKNEVVTETQVSANAPQTQESQVHTARS